MNTDASSIVSYIYKYHKIMKSFGLIFLGISVTSKVMSEDHSPLSNPFTPQTTVKRYNGKYFTAVFFLAS